MVCGLRKAKGEGGESMRQYIVDAFTDKLFHGNQAAICVTDSWPDEALMMNIAQENNFSETAFIVKEREDYRLRWFTPSGEIDLCGHATLASAYVIMNYNDQNSDTITFNTLSGKLTVSKRDGLLEMEFPAYELERVEVTDEMASALGVRPVEAYIGRDLLCIFGDEEAVRNMKPDMTRVKELDGLLLHVSAKGRDYDCVSRSFAPKLGITEDPVCGSGHCHIAPYWSAKTGRNELTAYQASRRGGVLHCRVEGGKVYLAGNAVLYSVSELVI